MRRNPPNLSQRGVYVGESLLPDGQNSADAVVLRTYANALAFYPQDGEKPLLRVLMGNGAFKQRRTVESFIKDFVQEAARDNQAVEFITYDEAREGGDYTAAERARRFGRVLTHAALRGNGLHVLAHSNSAPEALEQAVTLGSDMIEGVTLLTPIGYAMGGQPRGVFDTLERVLRETSCVPRTIAGLGSLAVLGSLTASMASHFGRSPVAASQMARESFAADNVSRFREIYEQAPFPISVLLAGDDEFFPADESRKAFVAAGLPPTRIDTLQDATHLSTISDYRNGAAAYRFMAQQRTLGIPL